MPEFKPLIDKNPFEPSFLEVMQKVSDPFFTQKDTPFSPRMLTYYDSKELLLYGSEKGKKRTFTAEQLFWIYILNEITKLGYSNIENLQAIKYKFENTEVLDGRLNKFNFLQYVLAYIIYNKLEHHLKMAEDGSYSFFNYYNYNRVVDGDFITRGSHINIALAPIAKILWKNLTEEELHFKKPTVAKESYSHKELIALIESGNFETIEIKKRKDGKLLVDVIDRHEVKTTQDLAKMLNLMSHGQVTINYHENPGKPVSIVRSKRLKR